MSRMPSRSPGNSLGYASEKIIGCPKNCRHAYSRWSRN